MSAWLRFALPLAGEISLLLIAIYCVLRAQKRRIYPAFWQLLIFWATSDVLMLAEGICRRAHLVSGIHFYEAYFYTYWPFFAINAILMLRVLHEMFRHAVRSIPGVQKLGRPIFFWGMVVSAVLAFAAGMTPHAGGVSLLLASAQVLARTEAVLALCMLAFLAFASHTLGVSFRSRIFGVIFGFGLMATGTLVNSAIFLRIPSLSNTANLILMAVNFIGVTIWAGYFLRPEPARKLVAMPVSSPLMRWNDIAMTLGNPAGQVAVSYPPTFMTDVVDLVNRVMGPQSWPAEAAVSRPPGPIAS
jgi:hypothetical protein